MNNEGLLLARLLLGVPFVIWGALKLAGGAVGLSGGLTQMGLPAPLLLAYLISLFELVGGIAVVIGFPIRLAGILLALWCVATGILIHGGDATQLFKNLVMAGGFLLVAVTGAGRLALFKGAPPHSFGPFR
ncbi:DoxX family protein [Nordella sp. HKS 07]|uniref:DoxX family protein n=1 Tax=Nordella sp. HKS 07 TaxID=2712222 RepID=UPI0013E1920E|nr:DoxX family protein [Nordella sp. HKS 07]QIG48000.1 DoxX family protein [Nordella sp. HKS 07]